MSVVQEKMWMGRPVKELTREELLEVVEYCGRQVQELREQRDKWRAAGDPLKYLTGKPRP